MRSLLADNCGNILRRYANRDVRFLMGAGPERGISLRNRTVNVDSL